MAAISYPSDPQTFGRGKCTSAQRFSGRSAGAGGTVEHAFREKLRPPHGTRESALLHSAPSLYECGSRASTDMLKDLLCYLVQASTAYHFWPLCLPLKGALGARLACCPSPGLGSSTGRDPSEQLGRLVAPRESLEELLLFTASLWAGLLGLPWGTRGPESAQMLTSAHVPQATRPEAISCILFSYVCFIKGHFTSNL